MPKPFWLRGKTKSSKTTTDTLQTLGVRSGLEGKTTEALTELGEPFEYESFKINYRPAKDSQYTPDFLLLKNGIVIETKGRFMPADRTKHLLVKDQHSAIDIRFVFSNSKAKLNKTSKTTYAMWCEKHGFQYADKTIPIAWLRERVNERSLAAIAALKERKKKP